VFLLLQVLSLFLLGAFVAFVYSQVMSGVFALGLVGTTAMFWLNQENDPIKDITIENLEEYME
jgi:hypothetical protein